MPFGLIPFLLLFIPILEIGVFIVIGGEIGVAATLGMILLTAIVGSVLLRVQGFATLRSIQEKSERGEIPGRELVSGVMIMIAGVLLLTPGFVTDGIGFLLFFPPFRHLIWRSIASKVVVQTNSTFSDAAGFGSHQGYPNQPKDEDVVDLDPSEFSEKPNPDSPWNKLKKE